MQDGGEHFPPNRAMRPACLGCGRRAVGQRSQQMAVEVQLIRAGSLAIGVLRHVTGPAHLDGAVQRLDETGWQRLHGFVEQRLAGLLLGGVEAIGVQFQLQAGNGRCPDQRQRASKQPGAKPPHNARIASARVWSLAPRASGTRVRSVSKAASSWAP